jgi:hypothetical protein
MSPTPRKHFRVVSSSGFEAFVFPTDNKSASGGAACPLTYPDFHKHVFLWIRAKLRARLLKGKGISDAIPIRRLVMKRAYWGWGVLLLVGMLAVWPSHLRAQGEFEQVTGKAFDGAVPDQFYLETDAIPVQKRNAAFLRTPAGSHILFGLLDTSGYSSRVQTKYKGMIITEGKVSLGGETLAVGSYGFGLVTPAATSNEDAKFIIYNQAGEKVTEFAAKKDTQLKQPVPLQVVIEKGGTARLYLGRYWIELK